MKAIVGVLAWAKAEVEIKTYAGKAGEYTVYARACVCVCVIELCCAFITPLVTTYHLLHNTHARLLRPTRPRSTLLRTAFAVWNLAKSPSTRATLGEIGAVEQLLSTLSRWGDGRRGQIPHPVQGDVCVCICASVRGVCVCACVCLCRYGKCNSRIVHAYSILEYTK